MDNFFDLFSSLGGGEEELQTSGDRRRTENSVENDGRHTEISRHDGRRTENSRHDGNDGRLTENNRHDGRSDGREIVENMSESNGSRKKSPTATMESINLFDGVGRATEIVGGRTTENSNDNRGSRNGDENSAVRGRRSAIFEERNDAYEGEQNGMRFLGNPNDGASPHGEEALNDGRVSNCENGERLSPADISCEMTVSHLCEMAVSLCEMNVSLL